MIFYFFEYRTQNQHIAPALYRMHRSATAMRPAKGITPALLAHKVARWLPPHRDSRRWAPPQHPVEGRNFPVALTSLTYLPSTRFHRNSDTPRNQDTSTFSARGKLLLYAYTWDKTRSETTPVCSSKHLIKP